MDLTRKRIIFIEGLFSQIGDKKYDAAAMVYRVEQISISIKYEEDIKRDSDEI